MKHHRLTVLLILGSLLFALLPSGARAEVDICAEARKTVTKKFHELNHLADRAKAYGAWKARAWHAAVIASRRWNLIQQSVLASRIGQALQKECLASVSGTACTYEVDRKNAITEALGRFPAVVECPKDSSPDERFRYPDEASNLVWKRGWVDSAGTYERKIKEDAAPGTDTSEKVQFKDRYDASLLELYQNQPLFAVTEAEETSQRNMHQGDDYSGVTVRRGPSAVPVSWCKGDGADSTSIHFPLTWSRPSFESGTPVGNGGEGLLVYAGDTRFAPRDARGNVRPPSELAKEGYYVYAYAGMRRLLTGEPLTPWEVLDQMVPPPRLHDITEAEIQKDLPDLCKAKTAAPAPPGSSATDADGIKEVEPDMYEIERRRQEHQRRIGAAFGL